MGIDSYPSLVLCPTGSADGSDTNPSLPQPLSLSKVSRTPHPLLLLSASHLPMLAWMSMVALDREEWRPCGDDDLSFPTFI